MSLTLWDAASSKYTLNVMLWGRDYFRADYLDLHFVGVSSDARQSDCGVRQGQ